MEQIGYHFRTCDNIMEYNIVQSPLACQMDELVQFYYSVSLDNFLYGFINCKIPRYSLLAIFYNYALKFYLNCSRNSNAIL